jgi:hypothetical protein
MIGKRYKEKKKSIGENRYTVDSYPIGLTISIQFMVSPFHQLLFLRTLLKYPFFFPLLGIFS